MTLSQHLGYYDGVWVLQPGAGRWELCFLLLFWNKGRAEFKRKWFIAGTLNNHHYFTGWNSTWEMVGNHYFHPIRSCLALGINPRISKHFPNLCWLASSWYPKEPLFNGCFNWMMNQTFTCEMDSIHLDCRNTCVFKRSQVQVCVVKMIGSGYSYQWTMIQFSRTLPWFLYLDPPKGAEWMIRGAYTPSFRIKQHPLEDAGRYMGVK